MTDKYEKEIEKILKAQGDLPDKLLLREPLLEEIKYRFSEIKYRHFGPITFTKTLLLAFFCLVIFAVSKIALIGVLSLVLVAVLFLLVVFGKKSSEYKISKNDLSYLFKKIFKINLD
jgi:hypothetical protein